MVSNDGLNFVDVEKGRLYSGCTDATSIFVTRLSTPLECKIIRICPVTYTKDFIYIRNELYIVKE